MAKRPLNHFSPLLLLTAKPSSYSQSWDVTGTFAKPDESYISSSDFQKYDHDTGFGPDAKLDLESLQLSAYVEMREDIGSGNGAGPAIWGFSCEYRSPYSVGLERAERMVATLRHIKTVREGYESKGFFAKDTEEAMLQTLDAIGCTEFATLSTGFGVVNYNQRSGWEHHRLSALAWQLKKVLTAYAEHRQAAVA